jgi:hypothetical protein
VLLLIRDTADLRIMPLGASITQGWTSSDENGYRKHIRDKLRFEGWKVNMVGALQDGSMKDRVSFTSQPWRSREELVNTSCNHRIMKATEVLSLPRSMMPLLNLRA